MLLFELALDLSSSVELILFLKHVKWKKKKKYISGSIKKKIFFFEKKTKKK